MDSDHHTGPEQRLDEGDRVQVVYDCPDETLRGATGFVVCTPLGDGEGLCESTYLIEFDDAIPIPDSIEFLTGTEIAPEHLRLI